MSYEKYQHRREGAGSKTFFLVKYWMHDGFKVRELTKGHSSEKPVEEFPFTVRGVDPASTLPDGESVKWDDQLRQKPISRSRARPQNEKEILRADALLDDRRTEKVEVPNDVSVGNELDSDVHFLRRVKGEFWRWFYRAGFDPPISEGSDGPNHRGFDFAEALYDYLDLNEREVHKVDYPNVSKMLEAAEDEHSDLSWTYAYIQERLRTAGFYPTSDDFDDKTHRQCLLELCQRIKAYKEERKIPPRQEGPH